MKFGILSDLHLGHHGCDRRWHNRLLFDQAENVARAAVDVLNGQALDAVFVLGDITQAGEERQLVLACDVFGGLEAPWFAVPGNHDRPAVRAGLFDRKFAGHLIPEFFLYDGTVIAGLREQTPDGDPDEFHLETGKVASLLQQVERRRPDMLLLFSHMPLTDGAAWAAEHQGKDAGCLAGGEALLKRLGQLTAGRVAAFSGHQHWHQLTAGPCWVQCTTASLIECPMEVRVVTLEEERLAISTLPVAEAIAAESLDEATWVRGRGEDREAVIPFAERASSRAGKVSTEPRA